MEETKQFETQTKALIDDLKSVCANYGLGNDGNEFKIITQVFLYKFLNDKYIYELKQLDPKLASEENFDEALENYPADDLEMLMMQISAKTARFAPKNLLPNLAKQQNKPKFATIFDETLLEVAKANNDIFSVKTKGGEKIVLFDNISKYVTDNRDDFCKALVSKMTTFSFEHIFTQKFDFFATIFEYLIKDYNTNAGGKYAEYFTPHAVAKIMAACLVTDKNVNNVTCYDPSAGSGTLLMNIAHAIGEEKCTIYSQDISQKSSALLRLNLILNDLVHSIKNIIQGNTILNPYHKQDDGQLEQFDYIVSNPPFKLDFSDYSADLDSKANKERFFAGIPNVPKSKKDAMAIYLLFIQHIMHSLTEKGKAAIVVPTGFITAQSGIDKKIRQKMVESKMLAGVVSMPSNIFATTGTNVSILFLDKTNTKDVVLIDASNLGSKVKDSNGNQKTELSDTEEQQIIDVFNNKEAKEDFSVVVSYDEIKAKNYSLSAGQYFEVKIEYTDISSDEFTAKMKGFEDNLESLFAESKGLEKEIKHNLKGLKYE
ncbi:HsdM family class I SAM-dependent methyltransferase [Tenacibaculum finnmarkense]|uniref:site-specific DNA-methyltransferase (adenine-specific) n=1 Tax=Tenacibaculum finnmarkense genomovar finnmarkense TaxID=1458503 RepID=A0AAP1REY6_9FLAO|nr:class I SAM-dependent DNA methyltransferase [Tenacibaculum finnmarkense]MBE7652484.1 N-6 DNA methylase [Tenacibaculum finnmarkense genomovar finnmarkense]MBE7694706.1 N-6 DNA methylase [Tenacibaculum finnmarkense genomovar finnmarkense]MCD8427032.1 type I restriction-modification system subunit M [Tenacibaculum finnmarkense genomovar finnmarkense]MCG8731167.1 SAM-dependent DNA methyltransferase [Tenacibaculum finnmarkense]MCG8772685.1 SAM-dependent DNA methyltransferase [Tenacibaculum finnm